MKFKVKAPFSVAGDQKQAIEKLTRGIQKGLPHQVLLGVTGSGKTYTMAKVIEAVQKPVLVISHNKTLAAQLYQEFKEFFPQNGIGYFVSYYDYYQPEAYISQTDTYIAKETDINEEIDKLRLGATSLLFSRSDALIVASVSCIYNIGSPLEYSRSVLEFKKGQQVILKEILARLVDLHYKRSKFELSRGAFRVRGAVLEIATAYEDEILKVTLADNRIEKLEIRPLFGGAGSEISQFFLYPAKHYLTDPQTLEKSFDQIRQDLKTRLAELNKQKKFLEAHRLEQRVKYDLEMIKQTGYANGIENYSRYFDGRKEGEMPWTLINYYRHLFGDDFLVIIDESHMTVPQLRGMYQGDLSRKKALIDFGFRLPSCLDNRPLRFNEFQPLLPQVVYVSATPDEWELKLSKGAVAEQLIRPTGLIDPQVTIRPSEGQINDLIKEILARKKKGQRVLVTTLTKKMAEELSRFLENPQNTQEPILVHYLHADVDTLARTDILADLRGGKYDVVVGVNLLREGLDLPEVSLVAILDADKQGFLRSKTSLIQTMGRASRHVSGQVILYADQISYAMKEAIEEVERRRKYQLDYNQKNHITPRSIEKPIREKIAEGKKDSKLKFKLEDVELEALTPGEKKKLIPYLRKEMRQAAAELDFEKAAQIRDLIKQTG